MARLTKTGSSRRKGDEYQDLTALQLALEAYINKSQFQVFIEYEKAGALDDVVVVQAANVDGYQVKHAVSENAVYVADDFTNPKSVVFIQKFAKSWQKILKEFPKRTISLHLRSNRSLDAQLAEVVTEEGLFDNKFRENTYRKEKRKLRESLFTATGLEDSEFQEFLECFRFDLKRPSYLRLEETVKAELLDHKLGISDRRVFSDLKRLVEHHAIETADPITPEIVDSFLREIQTRYLLPQTFFVDNERFVQPPTLSEQLDEQLTNVDGEYVVVTGPPGSGKSTALTRYCDDLEANRSKAFVVVRYYCFVRVNDNRQRLRLEAKSLRVNLLTELQRRFPSVLEDRRFDYGEDRFHDAFEMVAEHCETDGKKLVVFLDGLDHVERDDELRESVIAVLPAQVPKNAVILIGTQELARWTPIALKSGRENHHIQMPLFSPDETRTYIVERCGIKTTDDTLHTVFAKSSGLPLYLRYLAEVLSTSTDPDEALASIPAAVDGDVRTYYETIWSAFDLDGRADSRYLSSVLSSLRFSVHQDELQAFQTGIPDTPRFEAAYRRVQHLLRRDDALVSVFHDSFRMFVLGHTSESTCREIAAGILSRLREEKLESARWFRHAFHYALEAEDLEYVVTKVNREFVDTALIRFRSEDEITEGIGNAIFAAGESKDIVSLARLGTLKYRTHERLEYTFDWFALSEILLYTGRVDQVVDSIYCADTERITGGDGYSLAVVLKLIELNNEPLAKKLFDAFIKDFHGSDSLGKHGTVSLYRCAGLFETSPSGVVRSIADSPLQRDFLDREELTSIYAPQLAAYLDGLVQSGQDRIWRFLKTLQSPFPNSLFRQLTIRAVGKYRSQEELSSEVQEFIVAHPDETNIEVAFHAAKAGLSIEIINQAAGTFEIPSDQLRERSLHAELNSYALKFAYWAVIFGSTSDTDVVNQVKARMTNKKTLWSSLHLHLLYVGEVVGSRYGKRGIEWSKIEMAIDALKTADDVPSERKFELLPALRSILDVSLGWLAEAVVESHSEKIEDWIQMLRELRSSFIWCTHYGIGEITVDYSFEFPILEKQAESPEIRARLLPLLKDCAETYCDALSLKGGARGNHYLALASLAARCGFKACVADWIESGIRTSLAYGYRKDVTLEKLTDVLKIVQETSPAKVLPGAAAILDMNRWIPHATDGRCTKHFAQYVHPLIQSQNRGAALGVLQVYYEEFARWQADESVASFILACEFGDPEFLWALAGILEPNESLEARNNIVSALAKDDSDWGNRLDHFVKTMVNPRHWPEACWNKANQHHARPKRRRRNEGTSLEDKQRKYLFEGKSVAEDKLLELCNSSFADFVRVFDKLKDENDYFSGHHFLDKLPSHIDRTKNAASLDMISKFVKEHSQFGNSIYWTAIGRRYLSLGEREKGLECLERAIEEAPTSQALETLHEYAPARARAFFVKSMATRLLGAEYHGFDASFVNANACRVLGDSNSVTEIYEDYLTHCEELFSQWPKESGFETLRGWGGAEQNENEQIVQLLLERLSVPAAEFGDRLVSTIAELAVKRSDEVLPILAKHVLLADGLQLRRLVQILLRLSFSCGDFLTRMDGLLQELLQRDDLFLNMSAREMRDVARRKGDDESPELASAIAEIERKHSSTYAYSGFRILTVEPSSDFLELIKNGAVVSFLRELTGICDVLDLDGDSLTAQIERRFLETGAILEEERKKSISMWRAFSHTQTWPVIWFVSDFHVKVTALLHAAVDEVLQKQRCHPNQIEAIWRIIQPSDSEYSASRLLKKPSDISPLFVVDKDEWIDEGDRDEEVSFESSFLEKWVVAFEFQQLVQDNPYHQEFVQQTKSSSAMIIPEFISDVLNFPSLCWKEEVVTHHPSENLTLNQFRDAIINGHLSEHDPSSPCQPFVAAKAKHTAFLGFHTLCSLASITVRDFKLSFDGDSIFEGEECVAFIESWQEGYSDEDYRDEPLSFGVRLKVSREFVEKVKTATGRAFATRTIENRFSLQDYSSQPELSSSNCQITIWPVSTTDGGDENGESSS